MVMPGTPIAPGSVRSAPEPASPFFWGSDGQALTPEQIKRRRAVTDAMLKQSGTPKTFGEGLDYFGRALFGTLARGRLDEAERTGNAKAADVVNALISNPNRNMNDILSTASNDWVSANPTYTSIVNALMDQQAQQANWAHEDTRLAQQHDWSLENQAADRAHDFEMLDRKAGLPVVINDQLVQMGEGGPTVLGDYRTPKAADPTSLMQNLQAAGLKPGTPEYTKTIIDSVTRPQTQVNLGSNSSKFVEESDKAAATRMNDIVTAGQTAPQTMADMQQLIDLGAKIGTGQGAQIKSFLGPYAQTLGINIEGLSDVQAYDAITSRLAPQMRATGSGSSSDRDVSLFFKSLPSLGNTQGGNEIIANTMKAVAQNKINAADLASRAQRGEITWQDADKQIRNLPDPYELFKQFQKETQGKNDGGYSPQSVNSGGGTTSSGLKWSIVQ